VAWKIEEGFDLEEFLARPLVARVATSGPRVRPVWFLWEDGAFWWLTGSWSKMAEFLDEDPNVALVVDSCDLETGEVKIVSVSGRAEVVAFDVERAKRKLRRYLGPDESSWDPRFGSDGTGEDPKAGIVRLVPRTLSARDASYRVRG
jgi:nitroimidazol reductase NimA-like FMN-containing flavoprotein (pyridoxamine 5'-phosphate oxidase superfamily)